MMRNAVEYLDAVRDGRRTQEGEGSHQEPEHRNGGSSGGGSDGGGDGSLFYLKDWHFQRLNREGGRESGSSNTGDGGGDGGMVGATETPFFFADDWLNWW